MKLSEENKAHKAFEKLFAHKAPQSQLDTSDCANRWKGIGEIDSNYRRFYNRLFALFCHHLRHFQVTLTGFHGGNNLTTADELTVAKNSIHGHRRDDSTFQSL